MEIIRIRKHPSNLQYPHQSITDGQQSSHIEHMPATLYAIYFAGLPPNNMFSFKAQSAQGQLLRAYTLRHLYEQARTFEKSKATNPNYPQAYSAALIIRRHRVRNESDFGYKEELKTGILKKMHFVYLESVEDLIAFLWTQMHCKESLFGAVLIENIEEYFGGSMEYKECGVTLLTVLKLCKALASRMRVKGRVCLSCLYREGAFKKAEFEELLRGEDVVDWEVGAETVSKGGDRYDSEYTRNFYQNYSKEQPTQ